MPPPVPPQSPRFSHLDRREEDGSVSTLTWDASYSDNESSSYVSPPHSKTQDIWRRPSTESGNLVGRHQHGPHSSKPPLNGGQHQRQQHGHWSPKETVKQPNHCTPSRTVISVRDQQAPTPLRDNRTRPAAARSSDSVTLDSFLLSPTPESTKQTATSNGSKLPSESATQHHPPEGNDTLLELTQKAVGLALADVLHAASASCGGPSEATPSAAANCNQHKRDDQSSAWFSHDSPNPSAILRSVQGGQLEEVTSTASSGKNNRESILEDSEREENDDSGFSWLSDPFPQTDPSGLGILDEEQQAAKNQRRKRFICVAIFVALFVVVGVVGGVATHLVQKQRNGENSSGSSSDGLHQTSDTAVPSAVPSSAPDIGASTTTTMPTLAEHVNETPEPTSGLPTTSPSASITVAPSFTTTTTSSPTSQPTTIAPTTMSLSLWERIRLLSPETLPSLDDASSPQSLALKYTVDSHGTVQQHHDNSLLQIFALATLWFVSNATAGDASKEDLWLNDGSSDWICDWDGITCDANRKKVLRLELAFADEMWGGTLPNELCLLSDLEVMTLAGSGGRDIQGRFKGSIPESWGRQLTNLRTLQLYDNQLTGNVPATFRHLTQLRDLHLDGNDLSAQIPTTLGDMSSLETLELDRNRLIGPIPTEFGRLTNLVHLGLSNNRLSKRIPSELGLCSSLMELQLQGNSIEGSIPSQVCGVSTLAWLDLHDNKLTGSIPSELGVLTDLEGLVLHHNRLSKEVPSEVGNLSRLRVLTLSENRLTGDPPLELAHLHSLFQLHLEDNKFKGSVPCSADSARRQILADCNLDCECCGDRACKG